MVFVRSEITTSFCFAGLLLTTIAHIVHGDEAAPAATESAPPAAAARPSSESHPYKDKLGPFAVSIKDETWTDKSREREIPVRIYRPIGADGARPAILFSSGLAGSREDCAYLGRHWTSHGYVCIFMQHPGSDSALLKGNGRIRLLRIVRAGVNPENLKLRPQDVHFVVDELLRRNVAEGELQGRIDVSRIGVCGHSLGAYSALAAIGLVVNLPDAPKTSFRDDRLRAAISMAAPAELPDAFDDASADGIRVPCLHLLGTKGDSRLGVAPAGDDTVADRIHFDRTHHAEALLVTISGAERVTFTDAIEFDGQKYVRDPRHHGWIQQITSAFWDASLLDDNGARTWLSGEGFRSVVGKEAALEHKIPNKLPK